MSITFVTGTFECEICQDGREGELFVQTGCCKGRENGREVRLVHLFHRSCLYRWALKKQSTNTDRRDEFACLFNCGATYRSEDLIRLGDNKKLKVIAITEFLTEQAGHAALMFLTANLSKKLMLLLGEQKIADAVKTGIAGYAIHAVGQVSADAGIKIQAAKACSIMLSAVGVGTYLLGNIFTKTESPAVLKLISAQLIEISVGMVGNKILLNLVSRLFEKLKIKVIS